VVCLFCTFLALANGAFRHLCVAVLDLGVIKGDIVGLLFGVSYRWEILAVTVFLGGVAAPPAREQRDLQVQKYEAHVQYITTQEIGLLDIRSSYAV
jgi:hypothetical protein